MPLKVFVDLNAAQSAAQNACQSTYWFEPFNMHLKSVFDLSNNITNQSLESEITKTIQLIN